MGDVAAAQVLLLQYGGLDLEASAFAQPVSICLSKITRDNVPMWYIAKPQRVLAKCGEISAAGACLSGVMLVLLS